MLWLLAFGLLLEKASGWKVLLACYLSGGIAGGIAYAVFPYGTPQPVLVGASAATLSVAAAAVLSGAVSHSPFPQALKVFIFALAIIAATNFLYLSFAHINASLPSHIAGIAVGITAGTAIKSRHNALKREQIATAGLLKELNTLVSKANTRGFESLSEAERLRLFQISGLDKLNFHNKKLPECHTP